MDLCLTYESSGRKRNRLKPQTSILQKKQQPHGMKTRGEVRLSFQREVAGKII